MLQSHVVALDLKVFDSDTDARHTHARLVTLRRPNAVVARRMPKSSVT